MKEMHMLYEWEYETILELRLMYGTEQSQLTDRKQYISYEEWYEQLWLERLVIKHGLQISKGI